MNVVDGTPIAPPVERTKASFASFKAFPAKRIMVAVAFGQSNAANLGETPRKAGPGVFNYYQGHLYQAQDPLQGADGQSGSVWTRLGDKLIASKRYDAVAFASLAVGTTEIARWQPGGDLLPGVVKTVHGLKAQGLTVTHLLWHQGEADARLHTSKEAYKASFSQIVASLRQQGITAPIYVCVSSRCQKQKPHSQVRQAQQEVVNVVQGIYAGPDTDALGYAYRYDGCHFSDEGLEKVADLWMQKLR